MRLLLLIQVFLLTFTLNAQQDIFDRLPLPDNGASGEVVSPAAFLGYKLGERFTEYARSVEYFKLLAKESDRIVLEQYGKTYEKRPLLLLTVTSEKNISQLEKLRQQQLSLVSAHTLPRTQVQDLVEGHPVINSYSYNIHGNEASSTEAAMQVAYELATTKDADLLEALQNTINLLFICINPDGRDRYVYWANSVARHTGGSSPKDLEHYAAWPNGRTNHYWFDLNRDWVWGVHPESRGHTAAYQKWMPQVHTDYHEQGYDANYFTVPGTTPRNLLLPDDYEVWADTFGRANIAEFNKKSLSYFTRDRFDFYYPSYGSSYPSVMGAIGMLTEQGGIGGHRAIETEDGYVLTLRQRVYDHYTTSIAQVKAAARNRKELINYSIDAWNPLNSKSSATTYIIEDDGSEYVEDVLRMLLMNGVEVRRTTETLKASLTNFRTRVRAQKSLPKGSLAISTDQPRHLFINSILSQDLQIEDSVMYDMSTWSAPLAYNLEAFVSEGPLQVNTEEATLDKYSEGRMIPVGSAAGKPYAWVIRWNQRQAPKALGKLWAAGYRVRAAMSAFSSDDGTTFDAGSLIVLSGRNDTKNDRQTDVDMTSLAEELGIEVHRFTTGRMKDGMDLASTRNFPVKAPKVAMLVEPPFNVYTSGQIYFLFDYETELPVDRVRISSLEQTDLPRFGSRYGYTDLKDYDVVILPDARNLGKVFGQTGQAKLKSWLSDGGTLIAIGSSAEFFTKESGFLKGQEVLKPAKDTSSQKDILAYADRTDYFGKQRIPGAALNATVDVTHPLAFGLKSEVYTLKFGANSLKPNTGMHSVGRYANSVDKLLASGYASAENLIALAGNTWSGVRPFGSGKIVYFMDNPHYRMFWRGPSRMMQNAVMIVPGM